MSVHEVYDLVVVGAGPAGLSAARTAARLGFNTIVVDRLADPGDLGHPCNAVLVPAPGFVSSRPMFDGLLFPQLDLWIPGSLITVREAVQRCLSPRGLEYQTIFADGADAAPAIIDKNGLLKLMVEQAASRQAEFRFGTEVTGLLHEGERVVGVQTDAGDIRAQIVISAEGTSGDLCEAAGICPRPATEHLLVLSEELAAPAVRSQDLGRVVTLGKHAGVPGFASLLATAPGHATVTFTTLASQLDCATVEAMAPVVDTYAGDERVCGLLAGARALGRTSHLIPIRQAPPSLVADGFMAIGDAATPAGYLGILPAIFAGRQAALIAAEALDEGDTSAAHHLSAYDQLYRALILPALQAEAKATMALLKMADDELDRLAALLNWLHLPIPFLGYKHNVEWDTVCALVRQFSLAACDWDLLRRVVAEPADGPRVPVIPPAVTIPCEARVALP